MLIVLYVLALILAIALVLRSAVALSAAIDGQMTHCPRCGKNRCMQVTNGIDETYPTGRGTGRFYLCASCGQRSFWSNDDDDWQDASEAKFDWAYREPGR
jgi:hypothetical protein